MIKKIAFLFVLFQLLSCSSSSNMLATSENSLNGKWNWVSSTGGFIGSTITPASEKKTMTIEISNSTIKRYENGKLLSENTFEIKNLHSIYGDNKKMIVIEDRPNQSFEIKDNKLFLNDECNDCYQSEYVRIK
ncbi:hypothetical protein D0817_12240 [Flavobacterium cupreum]|uniref:Lipocalin-like domain-containing protein n=1 Tax=Flavobacterium cupreum TaxID=2133766 RepID=A0A434A6J4_9FLAO|nr:hypothetical protein [Flavobacterium cupreum]RUT69957.1 hypothetical protein D0817_12240 [Flavobacterium cupreum]